MSIPSTVRPAHQNKEAKMNLKTIGNFLLKAGGAALNVVAPGAGTEVVNLVNTFLPADKKLPENATGHQVREAINTLPPEKQAEILTREIDVEIEEIHAWTKVADTLARADQAGASTRPEIANRMAWLVTYAVAVAITAWAATLITGRGLDKLTTAWPFILSVIGPPMVLLRAYFGLRTREKTTRYQAATGQPPAAGALGALINAIRR